MISQATFPLLLALSPALIGELTDHHELDHERDREQAEQPPRLSRHTRRGRLRLTAGASRVAAPPAHSRVHTHPWRALGQAGGWPATGFIRYG